MKHCKKLLSLLSLLTLVACGNTGTPPNTAPTVDLERYMGQWYEIASFPNRFQKGCYCTIANYTLKADYVAVRNSCRKNSITGKESIANGKAWVVPKSNNSKLRVQFFWPFKGDYWILYVNNDYTLAIVGNPDRDYLWFLSRTKHITHKQYALLINKAKQENFDVTKLRKTMQC